MFGEEIVIEIDQTLDQLIRNAEAIQTVDVKHLSETEIDAFQKTQESLLQHFMRMDQCLAEKRKTLKTQDKRSANFKIQEKLARFEKMKSSYHKSLAEVQSKTPIFSKRKAKRFI
jgi:DNA gyrase/topoisomerase IV subunit A